jgi:phosphatidylglycerol---prolipoprotein diacylglyceryl transferase
MKPILFTIGPVSFYAYGIFLALSLFLALFIVWRLYKNNMLFIRYRMSVDNFFDSIFVFFVSFGIGARLLHILEHWPQFTINIVKWLLFLHFPGFSFFGGLVGGAVGLYLFTKSRKLPFFLMLDLLSIGMAFVLSITRVGSLLNGDGAGMATNFLLRVKMHNLPDLRHPVQLYESLVVFGIFVLLYYLYIRGRLRAGMISLLFLLLIGIERFFLEMLRNDGVYLGNFRVSMVLALVSIFVSLGFLIYLNRSHIKLFKV